MEASRHQFPGLVQPAVYAVPQLVGDDALIRSIDAHPLVCLATALLLCAASDDLLASIPDDKTEHVYWSTIGRSLQLRAIVATLALLKRLDNFSLRTP
jgi:hypothetical protein